MAPTLNAVWENPLGGWIEDLTMFGCVERQPGPMEVVHEAAQSTLGGWVEDLTMFGCVERQPGPVEAAQVVLVTAYSIVPREELRFERLSVTQAVVVPKIRKHLALLKNVKRRAKVEKNQQLQQD